MQPLHMYLYLTFVAHSYGKRYNLGAKVRKIVELRVRFYYFLYVTPQI